MHWHEFYELGYTLGGRGRHLLNGEPVPLSRGTVFLLTPADFHDLVPDEQSSLDFYNVIFERHVLDARVHELLFDRAAGGSTAWSTTGLTKLEGDFRRMWKETSVRRLGGRLLVHHLLHCVLVELARHRLEAGGGTEPHRVAPTHPNLREALTYIDHHFRDEITLADAAAHVHLSPNYFSECFRNATGCSFQSYLQGRRLRFAQSLLASTNLSVTEICHASGFNNLSHFGRAFKSAFGQTPSACRDGSPMTPTAP